MNWLIRQYNDIKGNLKWAFLGLLWAGTWEAGKHLLPLIPKMPSWAVWVVMLVASAALFAWLAPNRSGQGRGSTAQTTANTSLSTSPAVGNFNATQYFGQAYHSVLQAEAETNIRTAAVQTQPNDREGFYVRLIAVGSVAYVYDMAWAYIFKSQILLLMELNRRALATADARPFYDRAVAESPTMYANYAFDHWLNFLVSHGLILSHPGGGVEISIRGRDFLKYLVHWGRSADDRKF